MTKSTYRQIKLKRNKITYKQPVKIWVQSNITLEKKNKKENLYNLFIFLKQLTSK